MFSGNRQAFWWGDWDPHTRPQLSQKRGTCAFHIKCLATRLNGGEQMLPEMFAWLQVEKDSSGASARGASLLLHFSWASCSCNSQHHASDITADAARCCRRHHTNPSSSGSNGNVWFPINQGHGHQNSSSDLCKYQRVDLKQNWQKVMQKSLIFLSKTIFMSLAKKKPTGPTRFKTE